MPDVRVLTILPVSVTSRRRLLQASLAWGRRVGRSRPSSASVLLVCARVWWSVRESSLVVGNCDVVDGAETRTDQG